MAQLRPLQASDYSALLDFLVAFPDEKRNRVTWSNRLAFWWDKNPAFDAATTPRGWIVDDAGSVAGFLGNIPTWVQVGKRRVTALNSTTWRVNPEHRAQSLRLVTKLLHEGRESLVFNTTPNADVDVILKSLKFQHLPGGIAKRSIALLDATPLLATFAPRVPARGFVAAVLRALQMVTGIPFACRNVLRGATNLVTRELLAAGPEFDALWERTQTRYNVTNVRDAASIHWYCFGFAEHNKVLLGCYLSDRLTGFMILNITKGTGAALQAECVDFWSETADRDAILTSLVGEARRAAAARGCSFLSFPHFDEALAAHLRRRGFVSLPVVRKDFVKVGANLAAPITDAYFVKLQGDYGL